MAHLPLISRIQEWVEQRDPQDWKHLLIVLPSRRSALFLQKSLAAKAQKPVVMPLIVPVEEFFLKLVGGRRSSSEEELFMLYEAYRETHTHPESFDSFLKWGPILLRDLDESDRNIADNNALFSFLTDIKRLENWDIAAEEDRTDSIKRYLSFWEKLVNTQSVFHRICNESSSLTQGLVYRKAAENWKELWPVFKERNLINSVLFAGLNAMNRAEEEILQQLLKTDYCKVLWDIPELLLDKDQEAGKHIREYLKWSGTDALPDYQALPDKPKTWHVLNAAGPVMQMNHACAILQDLIDKKGYEVLNRTALVLADESLLLPALNALPPGIKAANVTMGFPMSNLPTSLFMNYFFELWKSQREGRFKASIWKMFCQTFASLTSKPENVDGLSNQSDWLEIKEEDAGDSILKHSLSGSNTTDEILKSAKHILNGLKALLNRKLDLDSVNELLKKIDILQEVEARFGLQRESLPWLFRTLVQESTLAFKGEPLEGFQLMGILESRALDFEYVIMTSVNEGILPKGRAIQSLFPPEVRKSFKLPDYQEKDSIYGYHFFRLLNGAKEAWLLYDSSETALSASEPSRFLLQLQWEWSKRFKGDLCIKSAGLSLSKDEVEEEKEIEKTEEIIVQLKQMAAKGFSPSALALYLKDQILFFQRYSIGFQGGSDENILNPLSIGNIIHESLERLFEPLKNEILSPELMQDCRNKAAEIAKHIAAEKYAIDPAKLTGVNALEWDMLLKQIDLILQSEKKRIQKEEVVLLDVEKSVRIEISEGIALRGKIDRVEKINGKRVIVDYKTGYVNQGELKALTIDESILEKRYAFQLLCYALMESEISGEEVRAGLIVSKKWQDGLLYLSPKGKPKELFYLDEKDKEVFKAIVKQLIEEILSPELNFVSPTLVKEDSDEE